jgi:hypothetical protein
MPPLKKKCLIVRCPKCGAKLGETCKLVGREHPFKGSSSLRCHDERVALFKSHPGQAAAQIVREMTEEIVGR